MASLNDDRLAREIIQLRELDHAIILLEGQPKWLSDGQAMWTRTRYTKEQHWGLLFSLSFQGFSICTTYSLIESGELLSALNRWLTKETHHHLNSRRPPRGVFGKADKTEWQIHFLQGLPGVGYERAKNLVEHFGGLPLSLNGELVEVPGIGKQTAKRIGEIFG